jgi:DNA-binding beta-propeller fold protein YncE
MLAVGWRLHHNQRMDLPPSPAQPSPASFGMTGNARFEFDASDSVQSLAPPNKSQRFEGIAFSSSGNIIGVATSETDTVFLFRQGANGLFEDTPYCSIDKPTSGINYPHDVAFSRTGDTELLAVAQRGGAIAIFEKNRANDNFGPDPAFEICGPKTKLNFSDGVAFVPPNNDCLAACNLEIRSISFYRRVSHSPIGFEVEPVFELKHRSLSNPDGLAFSQCGRWLAIANHGNHSVSVFQRRNRILSGGKLRFGPEPVTIIKDPGLRHPHSVAFTPETNHLVVTNAGANYISVYEPRTHNLGMRWSQSPVVQKTVGPDHIFKEVNARNKMEGGPKGIAIHKNSLAICSPEHGIKIFSFRERLFVR